MNIIELIAERKIRESIERGEFDDLCGTGQPVDLNEYFQTPPSMRIVFTLLKNSGMDPTDIKFDQQSPQTTGNVYPKKSS
jgi:hypothetical protein